MIVVDASVAFKWLFFEAQSDLATTFYLQHSNELAGPDTLLTEVAGAIVRRCNMQLIAAEDAYERLDTWTSVYQSEMRFVQVEPARLLEAARLAIEIGHPLKDCIYLALAIEFDCELATCDAKFQARATRIHSQVKLLEAFG